MKKAIFLILIVVVFYPITTQAITIPPKFSLDPASPSINGDITPDDILVSGPTGPIVFTQGRTLGLQDDFFGGNFDNLDALSYGQDPIIKPVYFSVDRVAVGLPGSAVYDQAKPGVESAAGDVYRALPPFGSNSLYINESGLGLIPGFFGDDLDALELDTQDTSRTYFSMDSLSVNNGFGTVNFANDIFLNYFSLANVFAYGEDHIGLDPLDDLDALALWDVVNPGRLDPGIDMALFSLSTFSPSAFTYSGNPYMPGLKYFLSPADILFTDFQTEFLPGQKFTLWASAAEIGLRPDDELNALDTVVPEPSTILLTASGLGVLGFYQYWVRRKRDLRDDLSLNVQLSQRQRPSPERCNLVELFFNTKRGGKTL